MQKRYYYVMAVLMFLMGTGAKLVAQNGAYTTGVYQNLFKDVLNKTDAEINAKVDKAFNQIFYGGTNEKLFYPVGTDMAYILDVNNNDVRSEGMSYGMMICVQLDKKEEFDKLWKWAKTYMQYGANNDYDGYFAWQLNTNGTIKGNSPASDGEAYFITALFFASHRWGNGTGIFNYEAEAQNILQKVMSKTGKNSVYNLFNATSKQITFVPYGDSYQFTDPSYHLPGFWELWAEWTTSNTTFWAQTPGVSRTFLKNASNTTSGLTSDYSNFDGTPKAVSYNADANKFMYDAWRTAMNIGMDYNWFQKDPWQVTGMTKLLTFFKGQGASYKNHYNWDGSGASGDHSTGLVACNAAACLAVSDKTLTTPFVQELWNVGIPTGQYRYYDGMLYMLGLLNSSGNFKIYKPSNGFNVKLTAPANGSKFTSPASITLSATATSTTGTIKKVEFFNGTTPIGSATAEPYTFTWTAVPAGIYSISAVATDDKGATTTSGVSTVTVAGPSLDGTITVAGVGVVGDEIIELIVDDVVIKTWTLTTTMAEYSATANVNGKIRVNYTNDDGDKRDARIDYIIVAGTKYEAEDQAVNTGYYANGACGGGSNSELLHCTGYIDFETAPVSSVDLCPNDPLKTEPGTCGCGVAEGTCVPDGIALKAGWNLVGYPWEGVKAVDVALASVWQYVQTVKDNNAFYSKTQPDYLNLLKELKYSRGYFVYVSQDCTLVW